MCLESIVCYTIFVTLCYISHTQVLKKSNSDNLISVGDLQYSMEHLFDISSITLIQVEIKRHSYSRQQIH